MHEKIYEYDSSIPIFTNETFIATKFFTPKNIENNVCKVFSKSQWKFCTKQFNYYNNLLLENTSKLLKKHLSFILKYYL